MTLSERYQKVVLDGKASDPVPVLSDVPKGSVLRPILFLIFINDLSDNVRSPVHLFAEDCALFRNINSLTDCQILQDDMNSLAQWETDWQMKVNAAKCHSMRVTGTSLAIKYSKLHSTSVNKYRNRFDPPNTLDLLSPTTCVGPTCF